MMRLYDWGVAADARGGRKVAPVGVTDQEQRARDRMLDALGAVPVGVTARGWVIPMAYAPSARNYQRFEMTVRAERDASGAVQVIMGGGSD
jgi:hypothetical protein